MNCKIIAALFIGILCATAHAEDALPKSAQAVQAKKTFDDSCASAGQVRDRSISAATHSYIASIDLALKDAMKQGPSALDEAVKLADDKNAAEDAIAANASNLPAPTSIAAAALKAKLDAASNDAGLAYSKAVLEARQQYVVNLDKALRAAMALGPDGLDEAQRINAEKKTISEQIRTPEVPTAPTANNPAASAVAEGTLKLGGSGFDCYDIYPAKDDSTLVISSSKQVWRINTSGSLSAGDPVSICNGPPQCNQQRCMVLYPGNMQLMALGDDGDHLSVWDASTWSQIGQTITHPKMFDADLSSDGQRIVSTLDKTADVVNGKYVPVGDGWGLALWDAKTGRQIGAVHIQTQLNGRVQSVRFSPDGHRIVTGGWYDSQIYDGNTLAAMRVGIKVANRDYVEEATFTPDGKTVATISRGGTIFLWSPQTGAIFKSIKIERFLCSSIYFSPDSRKFVVLGDIITGEPPKPGQSDEIGFGYQVFNAQGTPLTKLIVINDEGSLGHPEAVFSHDGTKLAVKLNCRTPIQLWNVAKDSVTSAGSVDTGSKYVTVGVALFDGGSAIAAMVPDGTLHVWKWP